MGDNMAPVRLNIKLDGDVKTCVGARKFWTLEKVVEHAFNILSIKTPTSEFEFLKEDDTVLRDKTKSVYGANLKDNDLLRLKRLPRQFRVVSLGRETSGANCLPASLDFLFRYQLGYGEMRKVIVKAVRATGQQTERYCRRIARPDWLLGEIEIEAISRYHGTLITVVQKGEDNSSTILDYTEDLVGLSKPRYVLLYNRSRKHYIPFYEELRNGDIVTKFEDSDKDYVKAAAMEMVMNDLDHLDYDA